MVQVDKETGIHIFSILPAIRVMYRGTGYHLEQYQSKNDAWVPIKSYDRNIVTPKHIEEIHELFRFMTFKHLSSKGSYR